MNEFIHTFCVTTHLFKSEKEILENIHHEYFFFNSTDEVWVLTKYTDNGLRIHLKYNCAKEKLYDKKHRDYKAELIINPAKLLYPGEGMKKLFTIEEYVLAFEKLAEIIEEIRSVSGVMLWNEAKIDRIDLAKDVKTESDEYTREMIRIAKLALCKTGYHLWIPSQEAVEKTGWLESDAAMFYNHNQEVKAKIYNKLTDMKNQNYDVTNIEGLLRFELSLKRNYLKNNSHITNRFTSIQELTTLFSDLLANAGELLQTHIAGPLWCGEILSKSMQKKRIQRYCKSKKKKLKKMLDYRKSLNKGLPVSNAKVKSYFTEIGLSPIYARKEFKRMPSFACMLGKGKLENI